MSKRATRPLTIAAVALLWTALSLALWTHRDTYGREGAYADLWSVPHLLAGVLAGATGVGLAWTAGLAVAWELVEAREGIAEYPANQALDVLLALAGWTAAMAASATVPERRRQGSPVGSARVRNYRRSAAGKTKRPWHGA